jgi:hypothetical protein
MSSQTCSYEMGTLHGCIDKIIQSEGVIRLNSGLIRLIVTASDFKAVISKKERLKREAVLIFSIIKLPNELVAI